MPFPERKYTDEQKDAIASAVNDRGVKPARRVLELAAAGELTTPAGDKLPPFDVTLDSIRSIARIERERRTGEKPGGAAKLKPRDAVEALRVRLVALADHEMGLLERAQKTAKPTDDKAAQGRLERIRQVARCIREAAAIPAPNDPAPPKPGDRHPDGTKAGSPTVGGLAGTLLQDHRQTTEGQAETAHQPPQHPEDTTTHKPPHHDSTTNNDANQPNKNNTDASSAVRDLVRRLDRERLDGRLSGGGEGGVSGG